MPIVDQSYQRWTGTPHARSPAWILARAQMRLLLARRPVRLLLLAALGFFLVWGGLLYVETQAGRLGALGRIGRELRVDADSFRVFLVRQRLVHLLLCLAAADLVAQDRRSHALSLYLARPLRPRDYVLAKALALALPLSLATWIPGLALVLVKSALQGGVGWLASEARLLPALGGYSLALIVPLALTTLAISSLSASPRHASALLFAFLALGAAAGEVLAALTRADTWRLLSVNADLDQVAAWCFGTPARHDSPPWASALALAGLAVAAGAVLRARIRAVEVVRSG